ncbi:hypothetical protein D3C72_1314390 [compost metagenome]
MPLPPSLPGANERSTQPNRASAAIAIAAAAIAPARISPWSFMRRPRKMYLPSPPASMAAATVAVPTVMTVATRRPARITSSAKGSSTFHKSCQSVRPMARPASRTVGSTWLMPV